MYNAARDCCIHVDGGTFSSFEIGWLEGRRAFAHLYQVKWDDLASHKPAPLTALLLDDVSRADARCQTFPTSSPANNVTATVIILAQHRTQATALLEMMLVIVQSHPAIKVHLLTVGTCAGAAQAVESEPQRAVGSRPSCTSRGPDRPAQMSGRLQRGKLADSPRKHALRGGRSGIEGCRCCAAGSTAQGNS